MPKYKVDVAFWRNGLKVAAGEEITLSKSEAKYLGHIVSEVKAGTPAPAPADEPEAPAPAVGVTVAEKPHGRRKRHAAESAHDDSAN
jgi:hypothetical protein